MDRMFLAALWMNVACHLLASQSDRPLDAPLTLAQLVKVSSYALVLGSTLLENARLFDQVRHLAVTDPLTGLSNYRTLIHVMESEIQRSRRTLRPFFLSGYAGRDFPILSPWSLPGQAIWRDILILLFEIDLPNPSGRSEVDH